MAPVIDIARQDGLLRHLVVSANPAVVRQDGLLRHLVVSANPAVARQDGLLRHLVVSANPAVARQDGLLRHLLFPPTLLEPVLTGDANYWRQSLRFSVVGSKSLRNGLISNPPRRL